MKTNLLILLYCVYGYSLFGQSDFERYYDFNLPYSEFFNILICENSIYTIGHARSEVTTGTALGLHFGILDLNGELEKEFIIAEDSTKLFLSLSRVLTEYKDKIYSIVDYSKLGKDVYYLISIDTSLENYTALTKIEIPGITEEGLVFESYDIIFEEDQSCLLLGLFRDSIDIKSFVIKYDLDRNQMGDHEVYDTYPGLIPGSFVKLKNGNNLIVGRQLLDFEFGLEDNINHHYVMEIDSDLNVVEFKVFEDEENRRWVRDAILDEDGNVYYTSRIIVDDMYLISSLQQVIKLDSSYNKVWETDIGLGWHDPWLDPDFQKIIHGHNDGELLVAGSHYSYDSIFTMREIQQGVIAKINSDGDSLWVRRYSGLNRGGRTTLLSDIVKSPDGGYIAVGTTQNPGTEEMPTTSYIISYMIKVNEEGLIEIPDTTSIIHAAASFPISIYPNPAANMVYIDQGDVQALQYSIYDLQGKMLSRERTPFSNTIYSWDISHLANGTYVIEIVDQAGKRFSSKLLVQR